MPHSESQFLLPSGKLPGKLRLRKGFILAKQSLNFRLILRNFSHSTSKSFKFWNYIVIKKVHGFLIYVTYLSLRERKIILMRIICFNDALMLAWLGPSPRGAITFRSESEFSEAPYRGMVANKWLVTFANRKGEIIRRFSIRARQVRNVYRFDKKRGG